MKVTYPTKLSFFRSQTLFSLMGLMVVALLLVSNVRAAAQGIIHLGPGGTYVLSQPTPPYVAIYEGPPPVVSFRIAFLGNQLDPGESLQMDVLSSPTSMTPLATGIYTNPYAITLTSAGYDWGSQPWIPGWNPLTGAIRLTMLAGSVDVSGASLDKYYNASKFSYSYTIPEPDVSSLLVFDGAVLGGARWFARRKKRIG